MHHLVADSAWSDTGLLAALARAVVPVLSEGWKAPCYWIIDDTRAPGHILKSFRAFTAGAGFSKVVTAKQMVANGVNLCLPLHVQRQTVTLCVALEVRKHTSGERGCRQR